MEIIKFFAKFIGLLLIIVTGVWIFKKNVRLIVLFVLGYGAFALGAFAFCGYMALRIVSGIIG